MYLFCLFLCIFLCIYYNLIRIWAKSSRNTLLLSISGICLDPAPPTRTPAPHPWAGPGLQEQLAEGAQWDSRLGGEEDSKGWDRCVSPDSPIPGPQTCSGKITRRTAPRDPGLHLGCAHSSARRRGSGSEGRQGSPDGGKGCCPMESHSRMTREIRSHREVRDASGGLRVGRGQERGRAGCHWEP